MEQLHCDSDDWLSIAFLLVLHNWPVSFFTKKFRRSIAASEYHGSARIDYIENCK